MKIEIIEQIKLAMETGEGLIGWIVMAVLYLLVIGAFFYIAIIKNIIEWRKEREKNNPIILGDSIHCVIKDRYSEWNIPEETVIYLDQCVRNADSLNYRLHSRFFKPRALKTQRKEAINDLNAVLRDVKDKYLQKPPLTDEDYFSMGLTTNEK